MMRSFVTLFELVESDEEKLSVRLGLLCNTMSEKGKIIFMLRSVWSHIERDQYAEEGKKRYHFSRRFEKVNVQLKEDQLQKD